MSKKYENLEQSSGDALEPNDKQQGAGLNRRELLKSIGAGILFSREAEAQRVRKPSLKGSTESLDRQNLEAELEHLTKIENAGQLEKFIKAGLLVRLPENSHISVDPYLPEYRRYCRPWTAKFLQDLGNEHAKKFPNGHALMITSAVRPENVQRNLHNRNASPRSVHPTGSTVDMTYGPIYKKDKDGKKIYKHGKPQVWYLGMSEAEQKWMNTKLLQLERQNLVEATKEHMQPCYHVMVFKAYAETKH